MIFGGRLSLTELADVGGDTMCQELGDLKGAKIKKVHGRREGSGAAVWIWRRPVSCEPKGAWLMSALGREVLNGCSRGSEGKGRGARLPGGTGCWT